MKVEQYLKSVGLKVINDSVLNCTYDTTVLPNIKQIESLGDIIKHNIIAEDDKNIRGLIEYYTHLTAKLTGALIVLSCVVVFEFLWFMGG